MRWTAPSNNGSAIINYVAHYIDASSTGNAAWSVWSSTINGTANSTRIDNLDSNTSYYARVRAVNTNGDGAGAT